MRRHLLVACAALIGLLGPSEALAGIVVIDGRVRYAEVEARAHYTGQALHPAVQKLVSSNKGGNSSGAEEPTEAMVAMVDGHPVGPVEVEQIRAGLISEEEAASGCGGASAATGPAGLLPLAVAGAALLRRRGHR